MTGVAIRKFADEYSHTDFAKYFKLLLEVKGYSPPVFSEMLNRACKRLMDGFDGNGEALVVTLNYLFEHPPFDYPSEKWLSIRVFEIAINDQGGSNQPWSYIYYRRFRETVAEATLYSQALGILEDVRTAGSHPLYVAALSSPLRADRGTLLSAATITLNGLVQTFRDRLGERGFITEWPYIDFRPLVEGLKEFIEDPNRPNLLPSQGEGNARAS